MKIVVTTDDGGVYEWEIAQLGILETILELMKGASGGSHMPAPVPEEAAPVPESMPESAPVPEEPAPEHHAHHEPAPDPQPDYPEPPMPPEPSGS